MQNLDRSNAGTVGTAPPSGADEADPSDGRAAGDAIARLRGDTPGILLIGPRARATLRRILDEIRPLSFAQVQFDAAGGTIESLRAAVERAHASRVDRSAALLLVVSDADRLDTELLLELERAAAAAAEFGGCKFLFAARDDLVGALRQRQLPALATCLRTSLRCDGVPAVRRVAALAEMAMPAPAPVRVDGAPVRLPILVAGGVLALLAVMLTVGIVGLQRPPRHAEPPRLEARATPPPKLAVPAPMRAPIAPVLVVPASPPHEEAAVAVPPTAPPPAPPPAAALLLIAAPGDTLQSLYVQVYRGTTPPPLAEVASVNPSLVETGTRLVFPAPAAGWSHTR